MIKLSSVGWHVGNWREPAACRH